MAELKDRNKELCVIDFASVSLVVYNVLQLGRKLDGAGVAVR